MGKKDLYIAIGRGGRAFIVRLSPVYFKNLFMHYTFFVGIDMSKTSLDVSLLKENHLIQHIAIPNTIASIKAWLEEIRKLYKAGGKNTLFCWEHMDAYQTFLLEILQKKKALVWIESALAIKRSLGLLRGKSDRIDSLRIARYAQSNIGKVQLFTPSRKIMQDLKQLNVIRYRLLIGAKRLETPLKERSLFEKKLQSRYYEQHCSQSIIALRQDIKQVEEAIRQIIKSDVHLQLLYKLITSVPFAGERLAIQLLIDTDEFKRFDSANKLACYCGVAPFEHTSGTSVRGKSRVSSIANKRLKVALHMPALAAISKDGELRSYYLRKVAEGHPKMSVLNAVKNKLLHRVFACVRDNRPYEKVWPGKL